MTQILHHLTPTSHPDLFADRGGRLVHRRLGRLGRSSRFGLQLPDGKVLRVFDKAPTVNLTIEPLKLLPDSASTDSGVTIGQITQFMSDASGYIQVAETAIQLFAMLEGLGDDTSRQLADISHQLQQLMEEVGASDYLDLIRAMDQMRGNATALTQMLASDRIRDRIMTPGTTEQLEFAQGDFKLHSDIIALLDPDEGFFRRAYYDALIRGDGNWESVIPDRPVDGEGTTFEHRLAMPTVMYLIAVRLGTMKFLTPDFVSQGVYSPEIDNWWRRTQQLSDQMSYYVRTTPITQIGIQSARRQAAGQALGSYSEWQTHCSVAPPYSIAPVGAIDITTGEGFINWDYTQFDEWYLSQGDLHGRDAGYWPPSIGPAWYQPPPNATGLPPMNDATIQRYYSQAQSDAVLTARSVSDQIGVGAVSIFAWTMFDFAYPGVGTP
jgi:hypothetical protein